MDVIAHTHSPTRLVPPCQWNRAGAHPPIPDLMEVSRFVLPATICPQTLNVIALCQNFCHRVTVWSVSDWVGSFSIWFNTFIFCETSVKCLVSSVGKSQMFDCSPPLLTHSCQNFCFSCQLHCQLLIKVFQFFHLLPTSWPPAPDYGATNTI